jgi:hypothetical protein
MSTHRRLLNTKSVQCTWTERVPSKISRVTGINPTSNSSEASELKRSRWQVQYLLYVVVEWILLGEVTWESLIDWGTATSLYRRGGFTFGLLAGTAEEDAKGRPDYGDHLCRDACSYFVLAYISKYRPMYKVLYIEAQVSHSRNTEINWLRHSLLVLPVKHVKHALHVLCSTGIHVPMLILNQFPAFYPASLRSTYS